MQILSYIDKEIDHRATEIHAFQTFISLVEQSQEDNTIVASHMKVKGEV
jgi:hypothetical protein